MIRNNLSRPGARGRASRVGRWNWRALGVILPVLLASSPLSKRADERPRVRGEIPPPHAVNVWLDDSEGIDFDVVGLRQASRESLARSPVLYPELAARTIGAFTVVGSVALLEGDDATVHRIQTGFGVNHRNLAAVSTRFIETFGDDYDQIAVFLSFYDRASPQALAYQQPVKNDTRGIGLGLFDSAAEYGSKGRMQTVLNMKRINVYGRDAAADPDNGLYAVWAQEAAHRWLVYFKLRQASDTADSALLLGRQNVHWARGVAAEGSILDGYSWVQNDDGTFTPGRRGYRYGSLDQYGMGLLPASELPPFFLLTEITDLVGNPVTMMSFLPSTGRFKAKKIDLTVQDLIRANGERMPAMDPAAGDLRMGVVLLGAPGIPASQLVGEAFAIDNSRRNWTKFYDTAGGGRGTVCTDLYRPCRGGAFEFSDLRLSESSGKGDGAVSPGESASLELTVTNVGTEAAAPKLSVNSQGALEPLRAPVELARLEKGQSATVKIPTRVTGQAPCGQPVTVDVTSPGSRGPSRARLEAVFGLAPRQVEDFEGDAAGWRVNPDGTDTGEAGRWALGQPQQAVAFDYTLQPAGAFSGLKAFATGLSKEEIDNVEGKTTLESPPFPVGGVRKPMLSYRVYFVAAAFGQEVLVPAAAGSMKVLASVGGSGTWVEIDQLRGLATSWERRVVSLPEKLGAALESAENVRFRFVVEEADTSRPVVEAAIDEVGVFAVPEACDGVGVPPEKESGGGCRMVAGPAASGSHPGAVMLALTVMGWVAARRRARRRGPRPPGAP